MTIWVTLRVLNVAERGCADSSMGEVHGRLVECMLCELRNTHAHDAMLLPHLLALAQVLHGLAADHVDMLARFRKMHMHANAQLPDLYKELFSSDV